MSRPESRYARPPRPTRSRWPLALLAAVLGAILLVASSGCATTSAACASDGTLTTRATTAFRAATVTATCAAPAGTVVHDHKPASNVLAAMVGFLVRSLPSWLPFL